MKPESDANSGAPLRPRWGCLIAVIACVIGFSCATRPPEPPTKAELDRVVAEFESVRSTLDSIVVLERSAFELGPHSSNYYTEPDSTKAARLKEISERVDALRHGAGFRNVLGVWCDPDSCVWIPAIVRRGSGMDAPFAVTGYVNAFHDPADLWGRPFHPAGKVLYRPRLDGNWYAFSMKYNWSDDPPCAASKR
jgi:hypothetical protein